MNQENIGCDSKRYRKARRNVMARLSFRRLCFFLFTSALFIFIFALQPQNHPIMKDEPLHQNGGLYEVIRKKNLLDEEKKMIKSWQMLRGKIDIPSMKNMRVEENVRSIVKPEPIVSEGSISIRADNENQEQEEIRKGEDRIMAKLSENLQPQPLLEAPWFKPRDSIRPMFRFNSINSHAVEADGRGENALDSQIERFGMKRFTSTKSTPRTILPSIETNVQNEEIKQNKKKDLTNLHREEEQRPNGMLFAENVMPVDSLPAKKRKKHKKRHHKKLLNEALKVARFMSRRATQKNSPFKDIIGEKLNDNLGTAFRKKFSISINNYKKERKRKKSSRKKKRQKEHGPDSIKLTEDEHDMPIGMKAELVQGDESLPIHRPKAMITPPPVKASDEENILIRGKARPNEPVDKSGESITVGPNERKRPYERNLPNEINQPYQMNRPISQIRPPEVGSGRMQGMLNEGDREVMNLSVKLQIHPHNGEPWFKPRVEIKPLNIKPMKPMKPSGETEYDKGTDTWVKGFPNRPRVSSKSSVALERFAGYVERQEERTLGNAEELMSLLEKEREKTLLSMEKKERNNKQQNGERVEEIMNLLDNSDEQITLKPTFMPRKPMPETLPFVKLSDRKPRWVNGKENLIGERGIRQAKSFSMKKSRRLKKMRNKRRSRRHE